MALRANLGGQFIDRDVSFQRDEAAFPPIFSWHGEKKPRHKYFTFQIVNCSTSKVFYFIFNISVNSMDPVTVGQRWTPLIEGNYLALVHQQSGWFEQMDADHIRYTRSEWFAPFSVTSNRLCRSLPDLASVSEMPEEVQQLIMTVRDPLMVMELLKFFDRKEIKKNGGSGRVQSPSLPSVV